jgi:hypothetical protein
LKTTKGYVDHVVYLPERLRYLLVLNYRRSDVDELVRAFWVLDSGDLVAVIGQVLEFRDVSDKIVFVLDQS